ncbi:hypothetical protein TWF481_000552 [Arthrobotrys musiformis]|uniref:Uncharacterized protein n=1 Tax=Arthrobotrys musiformis TaxID=47236 RepID=A0AAV9WN88_9PEZI
MAATEPQCHTSHSDWYKIPSILIEDTLHENPFLTAAAGDIFTKDLPSTWQKIPRIATTAFTVPISPISPRISSSYESRYDVFSRPSAHLGNQAPPSTVSTSLYAGTTSESQSGCYVRPDRPNPQRSQSSASQPRLPKGFTSERVSSNPEAYVLKHDMSDSGILLTPQGDMKPLYHAQKQTYFDTKHPFPPSVVYHDSMTGMPMSFVSYSHPQIPYSGLPAAVQPNPLEGASFRMPLFKKDIIPTYDMGYYPNLLKLPSRPSDVLVYFNSICSTAALSPKRKAWIEDNLQETEIKFCVLDDMIFQMCEAYSGRPLRGPDEEPPHYSMPGGAKVVLNKELFAKWAQEIVECRTHVERLNKLSYVPAMNKCKVEVVWQTLVGYKDDWANDIFSPCKEHFWEASVEELEWMKEYHTFCCEMQRLMEGVEEDLMLVGRLENMVTAFRGVVAKAQIKFTKLENTFGQVVGL